MATRQSSSICLEARSRSTLRLKVAARRAAGWIMDGPQMIVTDFTRHGRSVKRYVQAMWNVRPQPPRWAPLT